MVNQNMTNESEKNLEYTPAEEILTGVDDEQNAYWNSFLPIFFDRMNTIMRRSMLESIFDKDLTASHAYYLIALNLEGPQTLSELSKFLDMDLSTSNRLFKVLKKKGLVTDDRTNTTSKKFHVILTPEGKIISDYVMKTAQNSVNELFKNVSLEDLHTVRSILTQMLVESDPDFLSYVKSPYTNPFYTYLGTHPKKENIAVPLMSKDKKKD